MDKRRRLIMAKRPVANIVDGVPVANVADIAYKAADGKIKTIALDEWSTSLGTAVGVVVIPSGFAPDGKARIVSLYWGSLSSTSSTSASLMQWSNVHADTSLTNHNRVPITNNVGSAITGFSNYGSLPSDKFTGVTSYVDSTANYLSTDNMIPSPYLGDTPNPAYYAPNSGYNNALADFNGKGNTDVLVGLGTGYYAANAARNYTAAGAEEIEWYLPAMGELGYMMVRFNKIQAALTKVSAPQLDSIHYWSSSEYSSLYAYGVYAGNGEVNYYDSEYDDLSVRPFAMLDF